MSEKLRGNFFDSHCRLVHGVVTMYTSGRACCRTLVHHLLTPAAPPVNTTPRPTTATSCGERTNYTSRSYRKLTCPVTCMPPYRACASAPQTWKAKVFVCFFSICHLIFCSRGAKIIVQVLSLLIYCRGVETGVYGYIPPKKSVQVNFLWGRNDVRSAIEHEYWSFIPPRKRYAPKTNFWLGPWFIAVSTHSSSPIHVCMKRYLDRLSVNVSILELLP